MYVGIEVLAADTTNAGLAPVAKTLVASIYQRCAWCAAVCWLAQHCFGTGGTCLLTFVRYIEFFLAAVPKNAILTTRKKLALLL